MVKRADIWLLKALCLFAFGHRLGSFCLHGFEFLRIQKPCLLLEWNFLLFHSWCTILIEFIILTVQKFFLAANLIWKGDGAFTFFNDRRRISPCILFQHLPRSPSLYLFEHFNGLGEILYGSKRWVHPLSLVSTAKDRRVQRPETTVRTAETVEKTAEILIFRLPHKAHHLPPELPREDCHVHKLQPRMLCGRLHLSRSVHTEPAISAHQFLQCSLAYPH